MTSPYLKSDEAAKYLRFEKADGSPDRHSCLRFLKAKGVTLKRRGAAVLVHRDDLEAVLEPVRKRRSV